jgi:hypothetical protein
MLYDQARLNFPVAAPTSHHLQARNLRCRISLCLVVLLLALLPLSALAQETRTITRPVRLIRGHAVINGSAQQYTRYVYSFRASEGQGLNLRITGGVTVSIVGPDSNFPLVEDETVGYSAGLPNTGIYKIIVTNKSEGTISVPFTLKISLSAPERD